MIFIDHPVWNCRCVSIDLDEEMLAILACTRFLEAAARVADKLDPEPEIVEQAT